MIRRYILIIFSALAISSCLQYDDTAIWEELKDHEARLTKLEKNMNANLSAITEILVALQNNDYVTETTRLYEDGVLVGYIIRFSKSGPVTIYQGIDGTDGTAPSISIRKAGDGMYYWTSDGEWMTDDNGDMIPASVSDHDDSYILPQFRVVEGVWYVSLDDGNSWREVGNNPGWVHDSFFLDVDLSNPDYVVLILSDGQQVRIPTQKAFQELEAQVSRLNASISSLQAVITAVQSNDNVTSIVPITESGKQVGYTIYFAKGGAINIYNGTDGEDGTSYSISAAQHTDGKYYWTLNGTWMKDKSGNMIPCTGNDGGDGSNGKTPKLKIVDGYWYVSYDGGKNWETEPLGPVSSLLCDTFFTDFKYDDDYVYFTLNNGEQIVISRHAKGLSDYMTLDPVQLQGSVLTVSGELKVKIEDLPYTQVTVYYSEGTSNFNIHTSASVQVNMTSSSKRFSLSVYDLKYDKAYKYCIRIKVKSEECFGAVADIKTEVFGVGKTIHVNYQTGAFTGSGYFYTTTTSTIINGFGTPILKSHMPERIDGLQFYVKGVDEEIQPLTAFIGYMTDHTNINTFQIVKSCTNDVKMTTDFSKVTLPLSVTRDDLKAVPDDGIIYVGYYPPQGYAGKPIGCGYYSKTDACFIETEGYVGMYAYTKVSNGTYVWGLSSQKNPRFAELITLVP